MSKYNVVMEMSNSTVVTEYKQETKRSDSYQSEAMLEKEFIKMLKEQGYDYFHLCGFTRVLARVDGHEHLYDFTAQARYCRAQGIWVNSKDRDSVANALFIELDINKPCNCSSAIGNWHGQNLRFRSIRRYAYMVDTDCRICSGCCGVACFGLLDRSQSC